MKLVTNIARDFQKVIANFTGKVRHDKMGGRDYLVAPMVMIVEGVLNGSAGPGFYPEEELNKFPAAWNSRPVVVYHPQVNGKPVSASDPIIIDRYGIGQVMNTRFEDGKLKAEAWLETDRMDEVDDRIMEAIENNQVMELSTGLFIEADNTPGEFDGKPYDFIARNFQPDHLALLPDLKGACSVADGAGFLLNQSGDTLSYVFNGLEDDKKTWLKDNSDLVFRTMSNRVAELIENEMSHSNIRSLLHSALQATAGNEDIWIDEVFDSFFVYEKDGKLWKQDYTLTDGQVEIVGSPVEVVRVTEFRTLDGNFVGNRKEESMDKKKLVDGLIANAKTSWEEADRESLMAMNESMLAKLEPVVNEEAAAEEAPAAEAAEEAAAEESPAEEVTNMSVKDFLDKKVPARIRSVLQNALNLHDDQKNKMIASLVANKDCKFTEEFLKTKDLEEITNLCALSKIEVTPPAPPRFNYAGQGDPAQVENISGDALGITPVATATK